MNYHKGTYLRIHRYMYKHAAGKALSWVSKRKMKYGDEWVHGAFSPLKLSVNINNLIVIKSTFCRIIKWQWNNNYYYSYIISISHTQMWELDQKQGWAPKNWCFQIVVLGNTRESPLDGKEIKP